MKTLQSVFLTSVVVLAIFPSGIVLGQSEDLKAQRAAVVKLRIHRANQADETATGLFVGKDSQSAYFITAFHAVKLGEERTVRSVQLEFYATPRKFDALVFDHFDADLDLAVVQIAIANLPPGLPKVMKRDVAADTLIHIIGHPSAGEWSAWSGSVQNENTPSGDIHHFITTRDDSLAEGYSGGPVFDSTSGFLGMHTSSTARYGIAAKSMDIVNQLKAWHVPTNNIEEPPPSNPRQADIDAINKVLDQYADAYNRKDKNALWKIWLSPPAKTKRAIEKTFGDDSSITMKVSDRSIELDGTTATATAQYSQEFIPKIGNRQRSNGPITFGLEKKNGVWSISSVQ
ncbi:MAG TPA: trypsin-like peptidase domain-containing protein [Candidatus Angelobacter sp.]